MKFKTFVFAIGLMLFASFALAASPISFVKNGNFSQCTYRTIGNAVDSAFENPRWKSGTASDGKPSSIFRASSPVTASESFGDGTTDLKR